MVARKPNLLEAFRAAAPESRDAQKRNPTAPPAVGGPFAPPKPAAERESARLQFFEPPRPPLVRRIASDRGVQLAGVLALVAVVAAFLFGRDGTPAEASGGEKAAESAAPAEWDGVSNPALIPTPVTAPGAASGAASGPASNGDRAPRTGAGAATPPANASDHDKAFWNLDNKYTVRVALYANDDGGLAKARAAVAYFLKHGYPAVQPIQSGDAASLIVCVGAAAKAKDLDPLLDELRELRGPPPVSKKPPFKSAYVDKIDSVLRRQ